MLSIFIEDFHNQIKGLSEARINPFFSYGYYCQCKKKLTEKYWLFNKKTGAYGIRVLDLGHFSGLLESDVDKSVLVEGVAYLIEKMTIEKKAEYINALYFSEELRPVSKEIIDITGSHSLLSSSALSKELFFYKMLNLATEEESVLELYSQFPWLKAPELLPNDKLLGVFNDLVDDGLLETHVMSLFLMLLNSGQLNIVCNFASNILSAEDSLCLLVRGGMVKYAPLINSVLAKSESSSKLVKEIRNVFGSSLDDIVPFDTQLSAWQGDRGALECFQKEFVLHWPKYEEGFVGNRLLGGHSFSSPIDLVSKESLNTSNVLLVKLFEKYQSLCPTEKKLGVASV